MEDTVNGDEIRQKEARDLMGYNGSYNHTGYIGDTKLSTEAGLNIRSDMTHNSELVAYERPFYYFEPNKVG